jgi:hypothetical protein
VIANIMPSFLVASRNETELQDAGFCSIVHPNFEQITMYFCTPTFKLLLWRFFCALKDILYTHFWELMKSMGNDGS